MFINRRQLFKTVTAGAVGTVVAKAAFPSGLQPLPKKDTPRTFDYPFQNIPYSKKVGEYSFAELRAFADKLMVREYIEARKEAVINHWLFKQPVFQPTATTSKDWNCSLKFPIYGFKFKEWLSFVLEDALVLGVVTIYSQGGFWYQIDASAITRIVNGDGTIPLPPAPAFIQSIQGEPICNLTTEELIYEVRYNVPYRLYGGSSDIEHLLADYEYLKANKRSAELLDNYLAHRISFITKCGLDRLELVSVSSDVNWIFTLLEKLINHTFGETALEEFRSSVVTPQHGVITAKDVVCSHSCSLPIPVVYGTTRKV